MSSCFVSTCTRNNTTNNIMGEGEVPKIFKMDTNFHKFILVCYIFPTKMLKYLNNVGNIFHATLTLN